MKSTRIARFVLAVAGVLMAGGLAGAQGPGGPGMGPGGFGQHRPPMERSFGAGARGQWWNNPNIVKQLSLTDDQRKAMDGIMQDHRMKLIDLQANLQKAEVTMGPLMQADSPDKAAIESQINKIAMARADLEKANSMFLLDIRMQLKPDQWKQLKTMRQNRMQQRGGMRGQMHGDGHNGQQGRGGWGQGGQRPGMGQGGQFRRRQGPPPQGTAPQGAPAAPAPATPPSGDAQ